MGVVDLITPAEFEDRMKDIRDSETVVDGAKHRNACTLMCMVLECFGYSAGVKVYKDIYRKFVMERYADDKK